MTLTNAELLHQKFNAARALGTQFRRIALVIDIVTTLVVVLGVYEDLFGGWRPFAVLGLAVCSLAVRLYAGHVETFAQHCRQLSIKALAFDEDVVHEVATKLISDSPLLIDSRLARSPSPQTLWEYYEPENGPGEDRLREIYAHSAVYSKYLTLVYGLLLAVLTLAVGLAGLAMVYQLALEPDVDGKTRTASLDVLCSIVFVFFGMRGIEATIRCLVASSEIGRIADSLIDPPHEDGVVLSDLTLSYDLARVHLASPPSLLYSWRWLKEKIRQRWLVRRACLPTK